MMDVTFHNSTNERTKRNSTGNNVRKKEINKKINRKEKGIKELMSEGTKTYIHLYIYKKKKKILSNVTYCILNRMYHMCDEGKKL
jgi:hypothetical protein